MCQNDDYPSELNIGSPADESVKSVPPEKRGDDASKPEQEPQKALPLLGEFAEALAATKNPEDILELFHMLVNYGSESPPMAPEIQGAIKAWAVEGKLNQSEYDDTKDIATLRLAASGLTNCMLARIQPESTGLLRAELLHDDPVGINYFQKILHSKIIPPLVKDRSVSSTKLIDIYTTYQNLEPLNNYFRYPSDKHELAANADNHLHTIELLIGLLSTEDPSVEESAILAYGYFLSGLLAHDTGTDVGGMQEYTDFERAKVYLDNLSNEQPQRHARWVDDIVNLTKEKISYFSQEHGTKAYGIEEQDFATLPPSTPRQLPRQESTPPEEQRQAA